MRTLLLKFLSYQALTTSERWAVQRDRQTCSRCNASWARLFLKFASLVIIVLAKLLEILAACIQPKSDVAQANVQIQHLLPVSDDDSDWSVVSGTSPPPAASSTASPSMTSTQVRTCQHVWMTKRGSNAVVKRVRCKQCGLVQKELTELGQELARKKMKKIRATARQRIGELTQPKFEADAPQKTRHEGDE